MGRMRNFKSVIEAVASASQKSVAERARTLFQKSLAIAEVLAVAEPHRADYQIDLVTSLVHCSIHSSPADRASLERAHRILQKLHREGRLDATEVWKIADIEQRPGRRKR